MNTQTARNILGCANDAELARELGLSRQAVNQWQGEVPPRWERWVKVLERANKKPATEGGSGEYVSWTQEEHPTNEVTIHESA